MRYHKHLFQACADALSAIFFEHRHADKCIEFYFKKNRKWGSRDRRFFAETVYDCVRWWQLYWSLLGQEPTQPTVEFLAPSLWRRGLDIPLWDEFAKFHPQYFERKWQSIKAPYIQQSFPQWLYQWGEEQHGENWPHFARGLNQVNQLVLRVNTTKIQVPHLIKQFKSLGIAAQPLSGCPTGVIIPERVNVFKTDLFKNGLFEVQDGSSQQVANYLDVSPGMRVIDACAGAGGKTLHIADLMKSKGKIISLDIHQWKLDQLKQRARRNSYSNIETRVIEGTKTIKRLKGAADRLLLDVPCSGLGVLRRNPDTKWKLTRQSLNEVQQLQAQILKDYSIMLKPGGLLLYSTCSLMPAENEEQVNLFLKNHCSFRLLKQRHLYPTRPGYDGFYMALIEKQKD